MYKFLKKMRRRLVAACVAASLTMGSVAWAALPEIMPLNEVRPGMWGTAYTVVDPSGAIRTFDAEVVGIYGNNGKMSHPRILVNVHGPLINETGGIATGMSGSPIYINGRLIGAISANMADTYTNINVIVTPIEPMLKIWNYPDRLNMTRLPQVDLKKMKAEREKFEKEQAEKAALEENVKADQGQNDDFIEDEELDAEAEENAEDTSDEAEDADADSDIDVEDVDESDDTDADAEEFDEVEDEEDFSEEESFEEAEDIETESEEADAERHGDYQLIKRDVDGFDGDEENPVLIDDKTIYMISGYNDRGVKMLRNRMKNRGLSMKAGAMDGPAISMQTVPDAVLEPGSAVGVALAVGDFSYGAIGTVTAVDGKRILAFGHPFLHKGNVNYFMTDANIISVDHGPVTGMKLGSVGKIIGRINQDRNEGVSGILGQFPQTMPVKVKVHDKDTGEDIEYTSMLAYDEDVIYSIAPTMVYSSIYNTLDRYDESTVSLKFALRSNYGKDGLIERKNMFFGTEDVAKTSLEELDNVLKIILGNKDREPDMLDLKVDVSVERGRKTAVLVSAVPEKNDVLPGEKVNFDVTLKPYRGKKIHVNVPYTVPVTQVPGKLALDVHGGGMVNVAKMLLAQQDAAESGVYLDQEPTVEEQLDDVLKANRNNEIVIESTVVVPKNDKELKESIKRAKKMAEKLSKQGDNGKKPEEAENKASTKYVVENVIHTSINVLED